MKRLFTLALASLVLSGVLVGYFAPLVARAASVYDGAMLTTERLLVQGSNGRGHTISDNTSDPFIIGIISGAANELGSYYNNCSETQRDSALNGFSNGSVYVREHLGFQSDGFGESFVSVIWDENPNVTIPETAWSTSPAPRLTYQPTNYLYIYIDPSNRLTVLCNQQFTSYGTLAISDQNAANQWGAGRSIRTYFQTYDLKYPTGYEGETPPSEAPAEKRGYFPDAEWSVDESGRLTANFTGDTNFTLPGSQGGRVTPKLFWNNGILGEEDPLKASLQTLNEPFVNKLPGYDTYYLYVGFVHPGTPWQPFADEVKLDIVQFVFDFNGQAISGSTNGDCRHSNGFYECEQESPYEDCSTYGITDLGGYFQCVIQNFGTWLRILTISLFMPGFAFFTTWQTNFSTFFNDKLGFLSTATSTIVGLFGGVIVGAATTSCTLAPPGTLFGAPFQINVCSFQQIAPNGFLAMQVVVVGATVIALCFAGIRKYYEVVDKR